MNSLRSSFMILLLIVGTWTLSGQTTQPFKVWFADSISQEYEVLLPEDIPFVGISAYCIDTNFSGTLHYRIAVDSIWGAWDTLRLFTDGSPYRRLAFHDEPISTMFSQIQFRVSDIPESYVVFRLFFPEKAHSKGVDLMEVSCDCQEVAYCPHDCWCPSGDCPKDVLPTPTIPTHFIIHHSAGGNSSVDYAAVVALYWDLHVNTNGWDDIGYNWLVDPQGGIYEGRGLGTQGAHFSCMNGETVGICVIGNYNDVEPTQASLESVEQLIAWLACYHDIEMGSVSVHGSSQLELDHVSAHRDGNNSQASNSCAKGTSCPGQFLYDRLSNIRTGILGLSCMQVGLTDNNCPRFTLQPYAGGLPVLQVTQVETSATYDLQIVSGLGQEVMKKSNLLGDMMFDISGLSTGLYFVMISSENKMFPATIFVK